MTTYNRWIRSLLNSIQLQFFISFISLPFLIAWGLPISIVTPISTLIFGPLLTLFLLISSIIFFLELLYLPNGVFIWCLEKVTATWLACLSFEQRSWLIGFAKPPIIVLCIIPCIALAIIHSKKITSLPTRIKYLGFFLIFTCASLKFFPYRHDVLEKISCNKGELTLIRHNKTITLIDPGFLAAKPSYESYIAYTLTPTIIQKTGNLILNHVIVCKFNKRVLDALRFLATKVTIRNLYIPAWKGRIPTFAWRSYAQLRDIITENDGRLWSISYKKKLYYGKNSMLCIEPAAKKITYYDATYQQLTVTGTINDKKIQY